MQMKSQPRSKRSLPVRTPERSEHIVLYDVPWEAYQRILDAFGDRRLRHSYLCGTLEIMSPMKSHDAIKTFLGRMIETIADVLDIDIQCMGSTTLTREQVSRGLQPDECYYIANEQLVRGTLFYDPVNHPPPDLAVEVDVTHAAVDRSEIYAGIGVAEVWRWKEGRMEFFRLQKGEYRPIKKSLSFPFLPAKFLEGLLGRYEGSSERELLRELKALVREAQK